MALESKLELLVSRLQPILVLCIGCACSLLLATNIRCHGALALFIAEEPPSSLAAPPAAVHWLGATPGMVTYLFVPLFTGIVDHFKLSYRICVLAASAAILVGSVMSTGFRDPGQLIITDTIVTGCGASLMLSTVILVTDDNFPGHSGMRILATTLVQGVAYATFFFVDAYAVLLTRAGWRAAFFAYGGAAAGLGLLGALLFARPPRPYDRLPLADDNGGGLEESATAKDPGVIDTIHDKSEWKGRLLSLSQSEMDSSRTTLLWLFERLLASIVSDGVFLFLLTRSGISRNPMVAGSTPSPRMPSILPAFVFSVGSTTSYLAGAVLGCLIQGRLLTVYMTGALINACALIGWAAVLGSQYNAELVFAWACGVGIGGVNTFAYAASEEATGVPARSMFPYTKLANGISIAIIQVVHGILVGHGNKPLDLLLVLLLLLSIVQFAVLIIIRQLRSSASPRRFRMESGVTSDRR